MKKVSVALIALSLVFTSALALAWTPDSSDKMELSVAITLGASADADYDGGVAVFTIAEGGLMYEASIGGQKFKYQAK